MDTPETASSALDTNQAAELFAKILEPEHPGEQQKEEGDKAKPEDHPKAEDQPKTEETPNAQEEGSDADETITIEVDGKNVEIKKSELPELYKGQLRQSDYTKKTMEVAEQRKAAEAEATKAREERQKYAQGLQQAQTLLQAQLQESSQIDWQKLLETDPVEFLKQKHIAETRQGQLQRVFQEQQQLAMQMQAEHAKQVQSFVQQQQQELIAKLPEWKDESKAKVEREAIKSFLKDRGLTDSEIGNITDHRVVLLAREAMLYQQTMAKASAIAKQVKNLPQKVERAGVGESQGLDRRSAAFKQLAKTGRVEDAAEVFKSIL